MIAPTRPALRWFGGKWRLAPSIVAMMPPHRCYVEPFGGAASVLLRKPRAYAEIYNDLDDELVTYFRVLRDPEQASELIRRLELTPYARTELRSAYGTSNDPVETARRLVVRSFQGFGANSAHSESTGANSTGFRSNSTRSGTTPAHDWRNLPACLPPLTERLRGVTIECGPAIKIMRQHDGPQTLHYVDPPYVHETRSRRNPYCKKHLYRHELSNADHATLLDALKSLEGMVIVSGYAHWLYDRKLSGWERRTFKAFADGAREREEVVWLNKAATYALDQARSQRSMFDMLEAAE
ncbi:DNA adenine methylase [Fulvimarina endophytica]|uniref:DNA adenine methylase n=1 Tax=Fulvimarina endophytica TaxID=2293836 RepID=A0A371X787_9HYPH|nr:DNA adenine methylase [Fulvimarina endophytica]RFC65051.1 DNA adenine methylase [Fulvimarina endophytica]